MKRILIAVVLMLFSGSLVFTNGQSPSPPGSSSSRLIISEYGTLVDVLDADGKSRFGDLKPDGFLLSYKFKGKSNRVWARGPSDVSGLLRGQVTLDGQSASITVKTDDLALDITSLFTLNEQTKELTIRRSVSVSSNSDRSVRLVTTEGFLHPNLIGPLKHRLKVTSCLDNLSLLADRPPHDPPCLAVVCSQNNIRLTRIDSMSPAHQLSLGWKCNKTLAPQSTTSDNVVLKALFSVAMDLSEPNQ